MAATPIYDLVIPKGVPLRLSIELENTDGTPKDITGYTFAAQIKKDYNDPSAFLSASVSIVGAATNGEIRVELTKSQVDQLNASWNESGAPTAHYFWDLLGDNGSFEFKILRGKAIPEPTVTSI